MQATIQLRSLKFGNVRTYLAATIFIIGNIVLPQLFHLVEMGGPTWLPIYFFTLVGAYIYGWRVGVLTALASPVINSLLFGMPGVVMLPAIVLKSTILALSAGYAAYRFRSVSLLILLGVIIAYQSVGTLGEWAISGSLGIALQDVRIGIPGLIFQLFGGWLVIKFLTRN